MANAPGIRFVESPEQILVSPADATLAAFVGSSTRGRIDRADLITGWGDYVEKYGGFSDSYDLALSTYDFLSNGGGSARILRVVGAGAVQSSVSAIKALDNATDNITIRAADPGQWGDSLSVSFFRAKFTGGTAASSAANIGTGVALPLTANFNQSENAKGYVLDSVRDINVGDILSVDASGGAAIHSHIVVAHVDAANRQIRFVDPGGGAGSIAAEAVLRTHSRHIGSTNAIEDLPSGGTSLKVKSTDGFSVGSVVSFIVYSDYNDADLVGLSKIVVRSSVVTRIVGQTLHFGGISATPQAAAMPANSPAKLQMDDGAQSITFTATKSGTAGNGINVRFSVGGTAGSEAVTVAGRLITVAYESGVSTFTQIKAAIDGNASALALVTSAVSNGGAAAGANLAGVGTTVGGAVLRVISQEFDMVLKEDGVEVEAGRHLGLSLEASSVNSVAKSLGGSLNGTFGFYIPADSSRSRRVILTPGALSGLAAIPRPIEDVLLAGGEDGAAPTDVELIGTASPRTGLHILDEYDDVDFAAAPGQVSPFFQQGAIEYAEGRADMLWLLDMPSDRLTAEDMGSYRTNELAADTTYAALYAPHGKIPDPRPSMPRGSIVEVPPTPAIAGLMASRVRSAGVHVSAANLRPQWVGITVNMSEGEHAALNEQSVNIIKIVRRSGIRLYGSRTLTTRLDGRRFTNVRRFLNFVKQSIGASLLPMTFSPANENLFGRIEHVVGLFLDAQWRLGALYPQTSRTKAYAVKCDKETTSSLDLSNGLVNAVLMLSPTTPAEQIQFKINVSTGGIRVDEQ